MHSLVTDDCDAQSSLTSPRRSPRLTGVDSSGPSKTQRSKRVRRSLNETMSDNCASQSTSSPTKSKMKHLVLAQMQFKFHPEGHPD